MGGGGEAVSAGSLILIIMFHKNIVKFQKV